jgi:uncharacterized coiled-coil protein SlyX
MGMTTDIIKYNISDRMREHRGQERNFDPKAFAKLINGGEVQEKIKHGDMIGYYGHWPRMKFGMNPQEGGFVDGKQVSLEPAIRTVYMKADNKGNVEHKVEFLDTDSGVLAERMHKSKAGGFSSAIDFKRQGNKQIPYGFYGFDFVFEPNYSKNRAHEVSLDCAMFDSVDGVIECFDEVADYNNMLNTMNSLYDEQEFEVARREQTIKELNQALDAAYLTIEKVEHENLDLLSEIERLDGEKPETALDGVIDLVNVTNASKFDDCDSFKNAELAGFQDEEKKEGEGLKAEKVSALDGILGKMGIHR